MFHIPPKLLLFLGIFWMLSYLCIGAVNYVAYEDMDDYITSNYSETDLTFFERVNQTLNFNEWLNVNFIIAEKYIKIDYRDIELSPYEEEIYDRFTFNYIQDDYNLHAEKGDSVFEIYGDGVTWYENSRILDKVYFLWREILNPRWVIRQESYEGTYLKSRGLEYDLTGNYTIREQGWTEKAWELITSIPSGFVKLLEFLSFKITSIDGTEVLPIEVRVLLNCLFVPIHFIILIGLSPYVARLVEAIAKLIDALTPLT